MNKAILSILTSIAILFVIPQISYAQINESQIQQIDSLFIDWNRPNHPGGTVGIMQDNKIVFSKAYGLASLEYLVPNTTGTLFNIASVSKQFTAMGIVLLQQQGKLSYDDDIRKYLPDLPEFDEIITIRHLLHHTSGLRSLHSMLGLAGWRSDDSRTNDDLYRFMKKQKDLNFKPGTQFMYCNTGYMLMVNIIEKITSSNFNDWMKDSIFEPLGMNNTYVEDNYNRIVANNATSYYTKKNGFERAVEYWGYVGSGNIHSNTNDLLKWLKNFYAPKTGWENAFKMLQTLDNLNNGDGNNYAFGVFIDEFNQAKRIQHGGGIGGFGSFICTYPDSKLSIVVLANFNSASQVYKTNMISEMLLDKAKKEGTPKRIINIYTPTKLANDELRSFEGCYWNDKDNYSRKIYLKNDTLRYSRGENNESKIIPIGKNEFQMLNVSADLKIKFVSELEGKVMIVTVDDGDPIPSKEYELIDHSKEELLSYTGDFYSPELETTYSISMVDGKLMCHHMRHGDFDLAVLKKDVLKGQWPFNIAKFKRNIKGEIIGLLVSNDRVLNLWFEKQSYGINE